MQAVLGRFRTGYLLAAALLLGLEILIATTVRDAWVRPYGGDVLAPVFLYCLVRGGTAASGRAALAGSLLVAYGLEGLQYAQLLSLWGLERVPLARIVLGSQFEWADGLAYSLGAVAVLAIEWVRRPGWHFWRPSGG